MTHSKPFCQDGLQSICIEVFNDLATGLYIFFTIALRYLHIRFSSRTKLRNYNRKIYSLLTIVTELSRCMIAVVFGFRYLCST